MNSRAHTPLHLVAKLEPGSKVLTAGFLCIDPKTHALTLTSLHGELPVRLEAEHVQGRIQAQGTWKGDHLAIESTISWPGAAPKHTSAHQARAHALSTIRQHFDHHHFLEVHTPHWVPEPGTDPYLEAFCAPFILPEEVKTSNPTRHGWLHTSPEFTMKRMLCEGAERIWQAATVWRNGEVSQVHSPEFTLIEWYRAWEQLDAIMDDVESIVRALLPSNQAHIFDPISQETTSIDLPNTPFAHLTMQEAFLACCDFDLLDALEYPTLYHHTCRLNLLDVPPPPPSKDTKDHPHQWDMLFFDLQITHLDPFLATQGAIFLTQWPAPLAVLARLHPEDPRCSERFELYVGGLELANGFGELTDPVEQGLRFDEDLERRRLLGYPTYPKPKRFLQALQEGMPPSVGVALGLERVLMLQHGASHIRQVAPYGLFRDQETQEIQWD